MRVSFRSPPQRRLNVDCYNISPDLNFILLYECEHDESNGTKYYVYEIFSTTFYALTPTDSEEVELQKILWSPASYNSSNLVNNNNNSQKRVLPHSKSKARQVEKSKLAQAIAFIHDYDIYYKPKIHSDLVIRITTNGKHKDASSYSLERQLMGKFLERLLTLTRTPCFRSFAVMNIHQRRNYSKTFSGRKMYSSRRKKALRSRSDLISHSRCKIWDEKAVSEFT